MSADPDRSAALASTAARAQLASCTNLFGKLKTPTIAHGNRITCSVPLRTGQGVSVRIYLKLRLSNAIRQQILGSYYCWERADPIDLQCLAMGQVGTAHIASLDILLAGFALALFEPLLYCGQLFVVSLITACSHYIGEDMWIAFVLGFSYLYLVSNPLSMALFTVTGLRIVGVWICVCPSYVFKS
jgi:hypothetical protein